MLPNRIGAIAVEKYSRQRREPWRESVVEECEHPPHPPVGWVFLSARPGELPPQLAGLWLFIGAKIRDSRARGCEALRRTGFMIERYGAACVTRTRDPRITNAMLYQLS